MTALSAAACSSASPLLVDAGSDAKYDAPALQDGSVDVVVACGPVDVSGYQPASLVPPNAPHANKCTAQQVSDYAQCQGAKISSYCTEFADGQPGQTCRACIETQSTDMRWGVIVFTNGNGSFNVEGCVDDALAQVQQEKANGGAGSCGDALFASYGCQQAACSACQSAAFDTCVASAAQGGCKSYGSLVESKTGPCGALLSDASPPDVNTCFPDTSISDPTQREVDWLTRMVGYMCGP